MSARLDIASLSRELSWTRDYAWLHLWCALGWTKYGLSTESAHSWGKVWRCVAQR